jgi:serine/threonine-protein kinase
MLEDHVARDVAAELRPQAADPVPRAVAPDSEAYRLYLKGVFHWNKRTLDDLRQSIAHFQEAIARDPAYAMAYAGLANAYNVSSGYFLLPSREAMPLAEAAANKALELEPELGPAHAAIGTSKAWRYDWPGSEKSFRRALELNPNDGSARYFFALNCLTPQRRYDEAIAEMRRALEIEPFSPIINANLASLLLLSGRAADAETQVRRTLDMFPDFRVAHLRMVEILEYLGRFDEAWPHSVARTPELAAYAPGPGKRGYWEAHLRCNEARQRRGEPPVSFLAAAYLGVGDVDRALDTLEQFQQERHDLLPWWIRSPTYDELRTHPRYVELMRRMNLEP